MAIELRLRADADSIEVAKVVTAVLELDAPQHAGLHGDDSRRAAGAAAADADDFHLRDGGDRGDLAAGGRHRDHEHRAGDGAGADAGDRHPPLDRRAPRSTSCGSS